MIELSNESRYRRLSSIPCPPTEIGREQFHALESWGERAELMDAYCESLISGKAWWQWTLEQYRQDYGTSHWPGWLQIERDFAGDPDGLRMIEKYLKRHTVNNPTE